MNAPYFPADEIPALLGNVVRERASSPKDAAIAGGIANGVASLVTQGVALVKGHDGQVHNLSSATKVKAATGSGKSYHHVPLTAPIEDAILACQKQFPKDAVQLFNDATVPAMGKPLSENPVAVWITDEAGFALQSMKLPHYPLAVSYLDGRLIQRNRVAESGKAVRPFFSILHLVQDTVDDDIRLRHGKISRGSGWDARTRLTVCPAEWVGQEDITSMVDPDGFSQQKYAARIGELLNVTTANMQLEMQNLPIHELAPEAKRELFNIQRECQRSQQDPLYAVCGDFLAKYPTHVIKLAGSWHVFENRTGGISREYVERAEQVIEYHLNCWLYERTRNQSERRDVVDAKVLYQFVMQTLGRRKIPYRELRSLAINVGLGSSGRCNDAMSVLWENGYAEIDGREMVKFFPDTRWLERVLNQKPPSLYR